MKYVGKLYAKIGDKYFQISETTDDIDKLKEKLKQVRRAIADYKKSEGCSCCQNIELHKKSEMQLAKLLKVPMYKDKSGYDFGKFETK